MERDEFIGLASVLLALVVCVLAVAYVRGAI